MAALYMGIRDDEGMGFSNNGSIDHKSALKPLIVDEEKITDGADARRGCR